MAKDNMVYQQFYDPESGTVTLLFRFPAAKKPASSACATLAKESSRRLISKRTKAGIARRMAEEGATWGRRRLRLNVRQARRMRESGMSYSAIAKKLGCSRAVVWRRLNLTAQKGW
jgi:Helix-turn-helix domain of resolvase